jgi:uroporphyrinogen-III synthase
MHLLVTRPEPDATATARGLEALGHSVTVEPMLTIVPAAPPGELPQPAGLIVTSGNGVRALGAWPQAAGWHGVPLFAVGEATGEAARAAGFAKVTAGEGEGSALIRAIGAALPPGSGPVIYAAARDLSGGLAERLEEAGYDVQMVEAYRAERAASLSPALRDALQAGAVDGALFYSRRTRKPSATSSPAGPSGWRMPSPCRCRWPDRSGTLPPRCMLPQNPTRRACSRPFRRGETGLAGMAAPR